MSKLKIYAKSILIPVLVGLIVGLITSRFMDYSMLKKPALAPPSALFPIVWTILYVLMGVSYAILKTNGKTDETIDYIYYLQLAINALWPIIFFVFKWRFFAFLWILLLLGAVITMAIRFYRRDNLAGLLQIPYVVWVAFATYLNFAIYLLNR